MPREATHFAIVLERIARRSITQFRDISDVDLNRPFELPESNTAFALATHLIGSAEYWVLQLAGGHDVHGDRPSEFHATATGKELRFFQDFAWKKWLAWRRAARVGSGSRDVSSAA